MPISQVMKHEHPIVQRRRGASRIAEKLRTVRGMLAQPSAWLHDRRGIGGAVDANGRGTMAHGPDAVQWTVEAACWAVADSPAERTVLIAVVDRHIGRHDRRGMTPSERIAHWNNAASTTHGDVLTVLDAAIAAAVDLDALENNPPGYVAPLGLAYLAKYSRRNAS